MLKEVGVRKRFSPDRSTKITVCLVRVINKFVIFLNLMKIYLDTDLDTEKNKRKYPDTFGIYGHLF